MHLYKLNRINLFSKYLITMLRNKHANESQMVENHNEDKEMLAGWTDPLQNRDSDMNHHKQQIMSIFQ